MAALVQNEACPPSVLREVADRETCRYRGKPNGLRDLLRGDFRSVLDHISRNPNTPAEVLASLAAKQPSSVVRGVAANSNTPVSILEELTKSDDWSILLAAARNPSTPTQSLERLSKHERNSIRSAVAFNPNTPIDVLEMLAADPDRNISVPANQNLKVKLARRGNQLRTVDR
jgi:hypothetical protein